jgi:hypothetical protein
VEYYSALGLIGIGAFIAFSLLFLRLRDVAPTVLAVDPEPRMLSLLGRSLDSQAATRLMLVFFAIALSVPLIFIRQATWSWSAGTQLWFSLGMTAIGAWCLIRHPWIARAVIPREQTALSLAWIRVVVCTGLLFLATRVQFSDIALLPEELIRFKTLVSPLVDLIWAPAELRNPATLTGIQWLTIGSLLAAVLGLGGRPVMFVAAFAYTIFYHVQITYTHFFHSGLIPLQILYALCFMPTHRALSLDRVISRRFFSGQPPRAETSAALSYGWCVYLCWVIYSVSYCATGLSKFWVNPLWASHGNVLGMSLSDSLHIIEYDFNLSAKLVHWGLADYIFPALGIAAMVIEWAGILILICGWARLVIPWMIGGLHLGIWFCHDFLFYELAVMPLIFIPLMWQRFKTPRVSIRWPEVPRWIGVGATTIVTATSTLILSGWLYSRDSFPLLSYWGMYAVHARKPLETVHYSTVYKVRASGARERTELTEYFSVLNHARWLDHIAYTSDASQLRRMKALFAKVFELEQSNVDPVVGIEIESNSWNVKTTPSDRNFGAPTSRLRFNRDGTVVEQKL